LLLLFFSFNLFFFPFAIVVIVVSVFTIVYRFINRH
jgi:hypothetical protein